MSEKQAQINELACEIEDFMLIAVAAGAAEIVGRNAAGHSIFRRTDRWGSWCEQNKREKS